MKTNVIQYICNIHSRCIYHVAWI